MTQEIKNYRWVLMALSALFATVFLVILLGIMSSPKGVSNTQAVVLSVYFFSCIALLVSVPSPRETHFKRETVWALDDIECHRLSINGESISFTTDPCVDGLVATHISIHDVKWATDTGRFPAHVIDWAEARVE